MGGGGANWRRPNYNIVGEQLYIKWASRHLTGDTKGGQHVPIKTTREAWFNEKRKRKLCLESKNVGKVLYVLCISIHQGEGLRVSWDQCGVYSYARAFWDQEGGDIGDHYNHCILARQRRDFWGLMLNKWPMLTVGCICDGVFMKHYLSIWGELLDITTYSCATVCQRLQRLCSICFSAQFSFCT